MATPSASRPTPTATLSSKSAQSHAQLHDTIELAITNSRNIDRHIGTNTNPASNSTSAITNPIHPTNLPPFPLLHESPTITSNSDPKLPGRYTVILTAASVMFIGIGISNTFGVFQEYYTNPTDGPLRHYSPDSIIVIGSTSSSLYLILGAPAGRFADLVGYRPSLAIGTALMVGALFAASVSRTYVQLLFSQGVMFGLGLAFAYLPAVSVSRQYWERSHGVANAIVVSGGALGGTILPFAVRTLINRYGIAVTFRALGCIAAGGLLPGVLFMRPARRIVPVWRMQRTARPAMFDLRLLRDARFLALLVSSTVAMVGFLPRYFLIPDSAVSQGIAGGAVYGSWLLGLMNGLSIVGRIGIGWYADRFGKVSALTLSFVLCGVGHLGFWLPGVMVPSARQPGGNGDKGVVTGLFTAFVVYTGVLGSGFLSLFPVVTSELFGAEDLASKQGLLNTIVGVGVFAGPNAVVAIVGHGTVRHWGVGVVGAGMFMLVGGLMLGASLSRPLKLVERVERRRGRVD